MGNQRFDWALIRTFVAVLHESSTVRAARKLSAQQPTVSRHIDALEAQLQVALFERTGRGVTPTAAGLAIAAAARDMLSAAAGVGRDATEGTRHPGRTECFQRNQQPATP
jgi:DNA-binding transcriptional LysR family regulator